MGPVLKVELLEHYPVPVEPAAEPTPDAPVPSATDITMAELAELVHRSGSVKAGGREKVRTGGAVTLGEAAKAQGQVRKLRQALGRAQRRLAGPSSTISR